MLLEGTITLLLYTETEDPFLEIPFPLLLLLSLLLNEKYSLSVLFVYAALLDEFFYRFVTGG